MKYDIVIAGSREQEVAVVTSLLAAAHVHASTRIHASTHDRADLILGLEAAEAIARLTALAPGGTVIVSTEGASDEQLWRILRLPGGHLVDAGRIAREHGGPQTAPLVLLGAASDFLPCDPGELRVAIVEMFSAKGSRVVDVNLAAFDAGRAALRHREIVDEYDTLAGVPH